MTTPIFTTLADAIAPAAKPSGNGAAGRPLGGGGTVAGHDRPPSGALPPAGVVIPVGQEPPRQPLAVDLNPAKSAGGTRPTRRRGTGSRATSKDRNTNSGESIRDPDAFYAYKNRLDEIRIFREETMRKLTRAELCVWEAIHNCQFDGAAQISQQRIAELANIKGRRHVSEAIKRLCNMGLLEVLSQGRYRPNGSDGHGLSSVYRVYPRPEPRLLKRIDREQP